MLLLFFTFALFSFSLLPLAMNGLPVSAGIAFQVVFVFATLLADVLTVRLVVAGRWKGVFGYET
jgi:hypothetical protein